MCRHHQAVPIPRSSVDRYSHVHKGSLRHYSPDDHSKGAVLHALTVCIVTAGPELSHPPSWPLCCSETPATIAKKQHRFAAAFTPHEADRVARAAGPMALDKRVAAQRAEQAKQVRATYICARVVECGVA